MTVSSFILPLVFWALPIIFLTMFFPDKVDRSLKKHSDDEFLYSDQFSPAKRDPRFDKYAKFWCIFGICCYFYGAAFCLEGNIFSLMYGIIAAPHIALQGLITLLNLEQFSFLGSCRG